jgi:hypothetical protein
VSPTLLKARGYRFYFFSREEERPHVHVQHAAGEAKFWLEPKLALAQNHGLSARQVAAALRLIENNKMKSALRGKITSDVEVTNVRPMGFWLMLDQRELFISYEKFPGSGTPQSARSHP